MPNLFFFVVVLRFDCAACGRKSEQRCALGVDQSNREAIAESIRIRGPLLSTLQSSNGYGIGVKC